MGTALNAAYPIAQKMIEAEEIPLKNREEREMFYNAHQCCTIMSELCTEQRASDEACKNTELQLLTHPMAVRRNSLVREKAQLTSMLKKEHDLQTEIIEWREKTTRKLPEVTEELKNKIEGVIGESVQFQDGTNAPVRG
jgi:phosphoenolpyruvate carboxylase